MSLDYIDVHEFDGKLQNIYNIPIKYSILEKKEHFSMLITKIKNLNSINTLNIIIQDLEIINGSNFQKENNLDTSDILIDILKLELTSDLLSCLDEQLEDITTMGLCPSGRVTRLLQIYVAFKK